MTTEAQLRIDLAACYRLIAHYGWDDLIFTHISARIPGPEHHFLINPYGMLFEEITASSLVKVDASGAKVSPSDYPVNPAGFVIHSAVHAARQDVTCVLHTHTKAGVAVSRRRAAFCRSRSRPRSRWPRSAITATRASRCATTRSRASSPIWARTAA
jgi:ribulose-5-phosphate 4-epimerase/fuculose-1-phosphate aldolase